MINDNGLLWLSTRQIGRPGNPVWDEYLRFIGLPHLREVRSIDSWCNPCVGGNYPVASLDELWERLDCDLMDLLPVPTPGSEYYLVFTDALGPNGMVQHPRLNLLGYDLSDDTWTSSLLNCSQWVHEPQLEPIARRTRENGLLELEDAKLAQALLPTIWKGDPHSLVTIWSLFEATPVGRPDAST